MAYRRPLTRGQSLTIALLWLLFAITYLYHVRLTLVSLFILGLSGFVVFYPIRKSLRERKHRGQ